MGYFVILESEIWLSESRDVYLFFAFVFRFVFVLVASWFDRGSITTAAAAIASALYSFIIAADATCRERQRESMQATWWPLPYLCPGI